MSASTVSRHMADRVIAVVTGIALAVTLVAAGFAACATFDAPTRLLAQAFSNDVDSPYQKEELVAAAVAAKHYTIDDNDPFALYLTMAAIAQSAEADGRALPPGIDPYNIYFEQSAEKAAEGDSAAVPYAQLERYVLTPDALSHLDDVYDVIQAVKPWLLGAALIACAGCIALAFRCGPRVLGRVLFWAGVGVLAAFALAATWVVVDFNGFFAAFHSLFFAAGTWTFSWDSLLICMYPPEFWMGMGAIWLAVTVAACAVCLIIGRSLQRNRTRE